MPLLILGLIVWMPTLLLINVVRGPWFVGTEFLVAICPLLALLVPGIVHFEHGGKILVGLAVAIAPVLLVIGQLVAFFVERTVFGNIHSEVRSIWGLLISIALWAIPGGLIYLFLGANHSNRNRR